MPSRMGPNDWRSATSTDDNGHAAWIQHVMSVASDGTPIDSAGLVDAIGTPADAAWSGTGDGTVIAILKAIAINTTAP